MEEDWRQKYPSLPLFPSFLFFFYLSYLPLFSFLSLFLLSFLPIFLSFLLTVHIKHHGNGTNQHVICQHVSTVVWHCFWKMPFKSDNLQRMNEWEFRIFLETLWNWTCTCWSWKRLLWIPEYDEGASADSLSALNWNLNAAPELIVWSSHQKRNQQDYWGWFQNWHLCILRRNSVVLVLMVCMLSTDNGLRFLGAVTAK